jgi:hypothetical protein
LFEFLLKILFRKIFVGGIAYTTTDEVSSFLSLKKNFLSKKSEKDRLKNILIHMVSGLDAVLRGVRLGDLGAGEVRPRDWPIARIRVRRVRDGRRVPRRDAPAPAEHPWQGCRGEAGQVAREQEGVCRRTAGRVLGSAFFVLLKFEKFYSDLILNFHWKLSDLSFPPKFKIFSTNLKILKFPFVIIKSKFLVVIREL